ncbi:MAG: hypothetical protein J6X60_06795, partial [Ruminiclostridium sp.]|nr:hypothetical protein [Ruminiclostridium sp.]
MELPKTASLDITCEDESGTTLTLKGVTSLSPKADLHLNVPVVCVDAKNNPAALTISTAAGKNLSLHETIGCKALTIKGSKNCQLTVLSAITADSITGFNRVEIIDGSLTVNKTLTTDRLARSNPAYLVVKSGAAGT